MCAQRSLVSGRKNRSGGWTPPEVGRSRRRWGGAGGSGQGTGQGSSGLGSGTEVGAPCSTAPPGSPPLTGGSSAETWSGSSAGGSVPRSGGLATPYLEVWWGLDCVKPHLSAAPARPSRPLSLVRIGRPSTNHIAAGPGGGDGDGFISGRFFWLPGGRRGWGTEDKWANFSVSSFLRSRWSWDEIER